MRKRTETRLVDSMISAYVDWREACRLVHDAYRSWASATGPRARVYARLIRHVGRLATSDGDLSGRLAA